MKFTSLRLRIWLHRWAVWRWRWWLPRINRQRLATGAFEGAHCAWGPFRIWDVIDHNRVRQHGFSWR